MDRNSHIEIIAPPPEEDLLACAAIMAASDPWITLGRNFDQCLAGLRGEGTEMVLLREKGRVAGFIAVQFGGVLSGYIKAVAVDREFRGTGLGGSLLKRAEELIFSRRKNVFLFVSSFNKGARAFYGKSGYEEVGRIPDFLVSGYDEILLRKTRGPLFQESV